MPRDRNSRKLRLARHRRVRRVVSGTPERPRLCVFRSIKDIYAQIIDDVSGRTIAAASSLEPEIRSSVGKAPKADVSKAVGTAIAQRAVTKGATKVVFDRGGYLVPWTSKGPGRSRQGGRLDFLMVSTVPQYVRGKIDPSTLTLNERVVFTRRIAKVVKGGRHLRFNALVIVGDGEGVVGASLGKALAIPDAVRKGNSMAKKKLIRIPLKGSTIPQEISSKRAPPWY